VPFTTDKTTPNKRVLNRNSLFQKRERVVITPARKQRLVSELSLEQREVFNIVMDGKSIFFTGGAGTGVRARMVVTDTS
jgi:hypothetical protein